MARTPEDEDADDMPEFKRRASHGRPTVLHILHLHFVWFWSLWCVVLHEVSALVALVMAFVYQTPSFNDALFHLPGNVDHEEEAHNH